MEKVKFIIVNGSFVCDHEIHYVNWYVKAYFNRQYYDNMFVKADNSYCLK